MNRYKVIESVGSSIQRVSNYEDLEIHHPSKKGREPGRVYATVDGEREEVLRQRSRSGELMVSKDFIITDAKGSQRIPVAAPISGVVGRVDAANGVVTILDKPGGELLVQVRHMDLRSSPLKKGDRVEYGDALGVQSGYGKSNSRAYGVHVHMDFNASHLDQFDRYLRDMHSGRLGIPDLPTRARATPARAATGGTADGVLEKGESGPDVARLQEALKRLGYRDAQGRELRADGEFGQRTYEAVEAFQRDAKLEVDGRVGRDTREALERAPKFHGAAAQERDESSSRLTSRRDALADQAMDAVKRLDANLGRTCDESSMRMAASLACLAKQNGFGRIDHVVLSTEGPNTRAGQNVFVVQGDPADPAKRRAHMPTSDAIAMPVEQSLARLQALPDATVPSQVQAQAEDLQQRQVRSQTV